MRFVQKNKTSNFDIESDIKLVQLASSTPSLEPSEECFMELSRALQAALEVIEGSLKE